MSENVKKKREYFSVKSRDIDAWGIAPRQWSTFSICFWCNVRWCWTLYSCYFYLVNTCLLYGSNWKFLTNRLHWYILHVFSQGWWCYAPHMNGVGNITSTNLWEHKKKCFLKKIIFFIKESKVFWKKIFEILKLKSIK